MKEGKQGRKILEMKIIRLSRTEEEKEEKKVN
jgi:hypothetical protein